MKHFYLIIALFLANMAFATDYYVAIDGASTNNGTTLETPLASVETAISKVSAGDIIWVRGGTYQHSTTLYIKNSGTENDTIFLLAYANEKPVLDFSGTAFGKRGMSLSGDYWKIKGFEMKNAGDNALNMSGSNNTIEFCSFHDNKDTGLQMGGGAHDNKIINCDSYFNADPTDYGDADGFAAKLDVGSNNYFYGCRAWYNCDDGWDGYMRGNDDVNTTLENCWTWSNGYFKDGTDAGPKANGNGFKVGGSDDKTLKHNFTLINCLAFYNKAKGFDQNNNKGNMFFYNCTTYGNLGNDFSIPSTLPSGKTAEVKNCVLFNGKTNLNGSVIQESNSWDNNFTVDESDFISIDTTGVSGSRNSDGSLPDIDFMHLNENSDLVNAGIDLGYPFIGSAPDLGAFETVNNVGVKQFAKNSTLKAYQQNNGTIALQFNQTQTGNAGITIYNLTGRVIYKHVTTITDQGTQRLVVNSLLSKGMYLVEIKNQGNRYSTKLFIE